MADGAVVKMRRDPWKDLAPGAITEVLARRGWPVAASPRGIDLTLGGTVVAVVVTGKAGEDNAARLCALHGDLPRAPRWRADGRSVRLYRAPREGMPVPSAENLHGAVAGVSILAAGAVALPPSVDGSVVLRWAQDGHPADVELTELPAWLADLARDPVAAARAWRTTHPTPDEVRELAAWEEGLSRHGRRVVKTFGNVMKIFRGAPCFAGRFRLNRMTQGIEFEGKSLPEGRIGAFREQVEDAPWGGFSPSEAEVMQAIRSLAEERAYHPVQDYLAGLRWDGTARLAAVSSEVLHAEGDDAERALAARMVRCWFISAVARALKPGEQVDTALVLVGPQGLRKSSFFRAMAGDAWFADTEIRIGDKDGLQQIHAAWITEWGEIDRITSARHAGEVKAFVARRTDTFRPPYGRITENFHRSCVIVGSTNSDQFMTDPTGSRRFWCVRVGGRIDLELAKQWRDQLWAEAVAAYRAGEHWWLDDAEDRAREEGAERHRLRDPWEAVVDRYVSTKWRADIAADASRRWLTTALILERAIDLPAKERTRAHEMRVGEVMRALGFRGEQHAVTKAEAELLKRPDGTSPKKLNHWIRVDGADADPTPPADPDDMPPEVDF